MLKYAYFVPILTLTACSILAPDRQDPKVSLPDTWSEQGKLAESNLPYIAWWYKFNDPNLNKLIESGLHNSNSIAQAQANIEQAQGQLSAVELSWIPSITALAGVINFQPFLPQAQTMYGGYAGYSSLNIFSMVAQQKSAKLNMQAKEKAFEGAKLDLTAQIAISYYTLIAQKEELKLYQQYIADLEEQQILQKHKTKGGLSTTADDLNVNKTVLNAKLQQKNIENNIAKSQNSLNYLLNQNPGIIYSTSDFGSVNTIYGNVSSLPTTVIGNRPDVAMAALQYKYAAQNVTANYMQLLPSFMLGYGPAVVSSGGIPGMPDSTTSTFQQNFITWSMNPAIFGQAGSLKGSEKYYYANYIDTVRKALMDISNDLTTNRITNERYQLTIEEMKISQIKYAMNYTLYKRGLRAYSDNLEDKISIDETKISVNQMKLSQMQAIIALYKDLGGGYKYNESQPITK